MMLTYSQFMQRPTFATAQLGAVPSAFPQLPVLGSHFAMGGAVNPSGFAFHAQLPGLALTTAANVDREPKSPDNKPSEAAKPSQCSFSIASILGRDDKPKPAAGVAGLANVRNSAHCGVDARSPTTPLSAGHKPSGIYYFYPPPQTVQPFPFAAQHPGCLEAEMQRRMAAPVAVINEIVRNAGRCSSSRSCS